MKPWELLVKATLSVIRKVITLLKAGNVNEAISSLEKLEGDLTKKE